MDPPGDRPDRDREPRVAAPEQQDRRDGRPEVGRFPVRLVPLLVFVVWAAVVWRLSSESDPGEFVGIRLSLPDAVVHGLEFAVGGFLGRAAFVPAGRVGSSVTAMVCCVAWGVLDEVHQSWVPERVPDGMDLAADSVGAAIGVAFHAAFEAARRRREGRG